MISTKASLRHMAAGEVTRWCAAVLVACALMAGGCSEPEVVQAVPKRADDRITTEELDLFLSVFGSLPDQKSSPLPAVMATAPQWSRNRTLPVFELVREEEKLRLEH